VDVADEATIEDQETDALLESREVADNDDSHQKRSLLLRVLPALLLWLVGPLSNLLRL
jgi:hypothetical protein